MGDPLGGAVIRPARAEDAPFLAWSILAAGRAAGARGWYDIALGLPEEDCLALLARLVVARPVCWWHYSNALVAEEDGVPAAALCAFGSAEGWGDSEGALAAAAAPLGWRGAEVAEVWRRGAYVFTCTSPASGDLWTIENVATRPQSRGRGLAGALLDRALTRGRELGYGLAQLSFVIGNRPAEWAYLKAGFTLAEEKRHPQFEAATGAPGLKRFVRPL